MTSLIDKYIINPTREQELKSIKIELNLWHKLHCTHESPYHLWCDGTSCWEYQGLASRFTEAFMKELPVRGLMFVHCPHDVTDFIGYHTGIMTDHPEWKERLNQMSNVSRSWNVFIRQYPVLEQLYNDNNFGPMKQIMHELIVENSSIYFHTFKNGIPNGEIKEYCIIGSLIAREAENEYDLSHCCVVDKLPVNNPHINFSTNTYDKEGKWNGLQSVILFHPGEKYNIDKSQYENTNNTEKQIINSFNQSKKDHNDKMLELYKKYKNNEELDVTIEEIRNKCWYHINSSDYSEKMIETMKEIDVMLLDDDIIHLLSIELTKENIQPFVELHNKINSLYNKLNNYKYLMDKNDIVSNIYSDIEIKVKSIKELLKELYMYDFTNELEMHNEIESWIQENAETFTNITYHYCPHYVLYDEKHPIYDETFDMISSEPSYIDTDDNDKDDYAVSTCLFSVSKDHPLHPNNSDEYEFEFEGLLWTRSQPIKKCVFYDEGLMNS